VSRAVPKVPRAELVRPTGADSEMSYMRPFCVQHSSKTRRAPSPSPSPSYVYSHSAAGRPYCTVSVTVPSR
jgi:hypothetical protein